MKKNHRQVYSQMFSTTSLQGQAGESIGAAADFLVKDLLESVGNPALAKRKVALREDARLLVLLLFRDMVFRPVLATKAMSVEDLIRAARKDLILVLTGAKADEHKEISGHAVLETVHANWGNLALKALGIWH